MVIEDWKVKELRQDSALFPRRYRKAYDFAGVAYVANSNCGWEAGITSIESRVLADGPNTSGDRCYQ